MLPTATVAINRITCEVVWRPGASARRHSHLDHVLLDGLGQLRVGHPRHFRRLLPCVNRRCHAEEHPSTGTQERPPGHWPSSGVRIRRHAAPLALRSRKGSSILLHAQTGPDCSRSQGRGCCKCSMRGTEKANPEEARERSLRPHSLREVCWCFGGGEVCAVLSSGTGLVKKADFIIDSNLRICTLCGVACTKKHLQTCPVPRYCLDRKFKEHHWLDK